MEMIVDGIPIAVEKKRIKHMYLRVKPDGAVCISAPSRMSDAAIHAFAASRMDWILLHQQRLRLRLPPPPLQYRSGEDLLLWGTPHTLQVLPSREKRCTAFLQGDSLLLCAPPDSTLQQRQAAVRSWYRAQLRAAIPAVRRACEAVVGCEAAEVRIRDMRTRWGSCNVARRRIWISLALAQKPPECLRCVMIHELVHLLELGHTPRFWSLMDRFCPDWRAVHRMLRGPAEINH